MVIAMKNGKSHQQTRGWNKEIVLCVVALETKCEEEKKRQEYGGILKWGFPQIIILFLEIFHYKPSNYWGTSIVGNLLGNPDQVFGPPIHRFNHIQLYPLVI